MVESIDFVDVLRSGKAPSVYASLRHQMEVDIGVLSHTTRHPDILDKKVFGVELTIAALESAAHEVFDRDVSPGDFAYMRFGQKVWPARFNGYVGEMLDMTLGSSAKHVYLVTPDCIVCKLVPDRDSLRSGEPALFESGSRWELGFFHKGNWYTSMEQKGKFSKVDSEWVVTPLVPQEPVILTESSPYR